MTKGGWAAVVAMILLTGTAAAQTSHGHGGGNSSNPSTRAFQGADAGMMKNMQVPYTGDPDVDFRAHMIPHHQGAIDMAKVALQFAEDPATRKLAETIIADQEREIAEMRSWLAARGR